MNLWRVPIDEASGKAMGQPEPLTAPTSYMWGLSVSRNGRRVAYATRTGHTNLQRAPFDPVRGVLEDDPVWVTQGSRDVNSPDVSPDGAWLVLATETEQEDIFIVHPDGSGLRQLTDDPYRDRIPKWSPDGKRIAFYSNRGGEYDIWTITPDGAELKPLMSTPGDMRLYPAWSPDGSRLVFNEVTTTSTWYIFDLIGSANEVGLNALPRIGETDDFVTMSSWSKDGKWLAGHTSSPDGVANGVVIYSFETKTYERLTETGEFPSWLSDSRRLLFEDKGAIHLLDRVTKERREILSAGQASGYGNISISPDNREIYFTVRSEEGDIWVANLD
jgi:Tol biopolymer transport system component